MNLTGGIVLYAVLWFLTLFIVAMIGQKSQADAGEVVPGTPAGAPADLKVRRIVILTTVITTLIWALIAWVILSGIVSREELANFDRLFRG
ncbi:DUF1467 family protein [Paracoccus onubensis]|uniref:DUF1467 family protein n=1 Tax=Paracoccus onubensis TaxID=1675788 RepID=UPI002730FE51|nr:DUF1467 family protein [Paracoccus onubensis]MDP0928412.1 DUF1467 family protein [Paracoccus onubensis]